MEALQGAPQIPPPQFEPDIEKIKRKLINKSVNPTPKIIHTLRKKEIQKHNRKLKRHRPSTIPTSHGAQEQALDEEFHFQSLNASKGLQQSRESENWCCCWEWRWGFDGRDAMAEAGKNDDIEIKEEWFDGEQRAWDPLKRRRSEVETIRFLSIGLVVWSLAEGTGSFQDDEKSCLYGSVYAFCRFVYTKLLAILGKARRPREALDIFNLMRRDCSIYPDMAAYRSIAVTLGQAGHLKELVNIIECMKQKPSKRTKNIIRYKNWNPVLEPDLVVYNAVMLQSGKFDLVHDFLKMKKSGEAPTALTYRVLVRAFWGEGKVNEAVEAVRDMEQRGVVGTSSVYYELACCLCCFGRWQDAMVEVGKMKKLSNSKPLEVTFTGMIAASMDAKKLFEEIKKVNPDSSHPSLDGEHNYLIPDEYTYSSMLKASASALQWDYFECVYKEMTLSGYQLDQSKHALLLPEASRAGKWHLLEHAFDTTLEAGEIPHPSWFTEMVFQLLGCGSGHMDDASLLDGNDEGFDFGRQDVLLQDSEQFIDGDPDCSEDPVMDCGDVPSCTSRDITGVEMVSGSSNNDNDDDGETNSHTGEIGFGKDMAYGEFSDPLDDKFSAFDPTEESKDDNVIIESLINGVDHSYESDLPSAYEVLEAWKESRRKDGIVFPFQLGHR
ncbi:hypothetical protein FEM48_Zijuj08G0130100 [Ziziphus jujuba var. spinosa]|uniref:Pentatricopeptide repeat-containing protein At5g67570, chloroplastic n=1 Tax=Ziziphus jujuba var. spinosa TaxID=714518 RepID=A0A978UZ90_ZIZJJ|nr:hypothetical protein FEM48_Zijuj08G0130100 [Ziziphus jujuba var. spinosa]